jgi:hypothetical protein
MEEKVAKNKKTGEFIECLKCRAKVEVKGGFVV